MLAQREAAERSGGGGAEGGHEGDDDLETAKGIARLFAEIGEAYTALIATGAALCMAVSQKQQHLCLCCMIHQCKTLSLRPYFLLDKTCACWPAIPASSI